MLFKTGMSLAILYITISISWYKSLITVWRSFAFSPSDVVVVSHSLLDHSVSNFFNLSHSNRSLFVVFNPLVTSPVRVLILPLGGRRVARGLFAFSQGFLNWVRSGAPIRFRGCRTLPRSATMVWDAWGRLFVYSGDRVSAVAPSLFPSNVYLIVLTLPLTVCKSSACFLFVCLSSSICWRKEWLLVS